MRQRSSILSSDVVQWFGSLLLSVLTVIAVVALTLSVADWTYIRLHPVAAYEEDLGYGLAMMEVFLGCAVIALPATGLLAWRIKKFIAHKTYARNHP